MELRPSRGGFLRPFGCGWFVREFLLGKGSEGSRVIDPSVGAAQADINFEYKEALARATARERSERIISRMVLAGEDVTEEEALRPGSSSGRTRSLLSIPKSDPTTPNGGETVQARWLTQLLACTAFSTGSSSISSLLSVTSPN